MKTSKKILIIDDEEDLTEMMILRMATLGHEAIVEYNGMAGLEKARTMAPDVILLDIVMPGMNGWEVCQILKGDQKTCQIPVIVMTAGQTRELAEKRESSGAYEVLLKPYDEHILYELIEKATKGVSK